MKPIHNNNLYSYTNDFSRVKLLGKLFGYNTNYFSYNKNDALFH